MNDNDRCPHGRAEDRERRRPEANVARPVPAGPAALQPPLLESRLAYRIQELAYGGLKPAQSSAWRNWASNSTAATTGAEPSRRQPAARRHPTDPRMAGAPTRSSSHRHFEFQGRRYKSLVEHCPRDHRHDLERLGILRIRTAGGWHDRRLRKMRCAIYTRKSTEEGLEQNYNSLDAQRDACLAYIASQKSEGWVLCVKTTMMAATPAAPTGRACSDCSPMCGRAG